MILQIALGIVLAVVILNIIMTPMFWKILGIILLAVLGLVGIWLIWMLCVWFSENFIEILGTGVVVVIVYAPVLLFLFLVRKWKFKKFKIVYYPQKSYGKLISRLGTEDTYTDDFENIENKVFTTNKLNRDNYEVQIIHQPTKDIYLYTKKENTCQN